MSITRHHSNQRMSQIVVHGDTVYAVPLQPSEITMLAPD